VPETPPSPVPVAPRPPYAVITDVLLFLILVVNVVVVVWLVIEMNAEAVQENLPTGR
jgi:hypothetical protein